MKIAEIHSEIVGGEKFKRFISENSDAFLCSGLFVLESEEKASDKVQLNFYIPSEKKLASVDYPFGELKVHEEEVEEQEKLKDFGSLKLDVLDLNNFVEEKFGKKFNKIIAVLSKDAWDLTCLDGMLGMCRVKVDAYSGDILDESTGSLNDIIRVEKGKRNQGAYE